MSISLPWVPPVAFLSPFAREAGRQECDPFFILLHLANDRDRIRGIELIAFAKSTCAAGGTGTTCPDREFLALFVNGTTEFPSIAHGRINPTTGVFLLLDVVAERLNCLVVTSVHLAGPAANDKEAPHQLCRHDSRAEVFSLSSLGGCS